MAAKRKPPGISGAIHPAVIAAAGFDCDTPKKRAWIAGRYNAPLHPLPVYFAERFDEWARLPEEDRERQIELETRDPVAGRFTLAGALLGEGILAFRERFARTCAVAATVGDREFFRAFDDVFSGLSTGRFPFCFEAAVVSAWQFLTELSGGCMMRWSPKNDLWTEDCVMAGDRPTIAELRNYLEAIGSRKAISLWPSDADGAIRRSLKRHRLDFADDRRGGDRRSKAWQAS